MRHQVRLFIVLAVIGLLSPAAVAKPSPAGGWLAVVNGSSVELTLNADGTGRLAGAAGTWRQQGKSITLVGADGSELSGRIDGKTLVVVVDGIDVRFDRDKPALPAGKAPAAPKGTKRGPGPLAKVPAKRVKVRAANATVLVPKGWRHKADGETYVMHTKKNGGATVSISAYPLTDEQLQQPVSALLVKEATKQLGKDAEVNVVVAPEDFRIDNRPAARGAVQGMIGGQGEGKRKAKLGELYIGAQLFGRWAYVVVGLYPAGSSEAARPAVDTILGGIEAKPPELNRSLMTQVAGCWRAIGTQGYEGGSSNVGSTTFRLAADGTFTKRSFFSANFAEFDISVGSLTTDDITKGTWGVFGETLYVADVGKPAVAQELSSRGEKLLVNGLAYRRCK